MLKNAKPQTNAYDKRHNSIVVKSEMKIDNGNEERNELNKSV